MSADWEPQEYRDSFEDKIMELVEKKAKEGRLEAVETDPGEEQRKSADVIDLTELLKRSLGGKGKAPEKPAGKTAAKPAKTSKSAPAKKATKASRG
jgi:DNA end-binding protein Ku